MNKVFTTADLIYEIFAALTLILYEDQRSEYISAIYDILKGFETAKSTYMRKCILSFAAVNHLTWKVYNKIKTGSYESLPHEIIFKRNVTVTSTWQECGIAYYYSSLYNNGYLIGNSAGDGKCVYLIESQIFQKWQEVSIYAGCVRVKIHIYQLDNGISGIRCDKNQYGTYGFNGVTIKCDYDMHNCGRLFKKLIDAPSSSGNIDDAKFVFYKYYSSKKDEVAALLTDIIYEMRRAVNSITPIKEFTDCIGKLKKFWGADFLIG